MRTYLSPTWSNKSYVVSRSFNRAQQAGVEALRVCKLVESDAVHHVFLRWTYWSESSESIKLCKHVKGIGNSGVNLMFVRW